MTSLICDSGISFLGFSNKRKLLCDKSDLCFCHGIIHQGVDPFLLHAAIYFGEVSRKLSSMGSIHENDKSNVKQLSSENA